ncbi:hypothetical protein BJ508DRAFT_312622 [Ascobolus immersus RN42]|uniref:Uncharacterized protein n=1 Tax=Ascobolus immersus RN42 TaxID=1160509 RepID=A0A3N4HSE4_ASCIM|nr:hypothetical protein BJ508DRAFT_312622 [Ascobolus immersus RN42]
MRGLGSIYCNRRHPNHCPSRLDYLSLISTSVTVVGFAVKIKSPAAAWAPVMSKQEAVDLQDVKRANHSRILTIFSTLLNFKDLDICIFAMVLFTFSTKALAANTLGVVPEALQKQYASLACLYNHTLTNLINALGTYFFPQQNWLSMGGVAICALPHSILDRAFAKANQVVKMTSDQLIASTSTTTDKVLYKDAEQLEGCLRLLQEVVIKVEELATKRWTHMERQLVHQPKPQRLQKIVFGDFRTNILGLDYDMVEKEVKVEKSNETFFDVGFIRLAGAYIQKGRERFCSVVNGQTGLEIIGRRLYAMRAEMMKDGMMDMKRWGDAEGMTKVKIWVPSSQFHAKLLVVKNCKRVKMCRPIMPGHLQSAIMTKKIKQSRKTFNSIVERKFRKRTFGPPKELALVTFIAPNSAKGHKPRS